MSASYSLITLICEGWAVEEGRQMEAREGGGEADGGEEARSGEIA